MILQMWKRRTTWYSHQRFQIKEFVTHDRQHTFLFAGCIAVIFQKQKRRYFFIQISVLKTTLNDWINWCQQINTWIFQARLSESKLSIFQPYEGSWSRDSISQSYCTSSNSETSNFRYSSKTASYQKIRIQLSVNHKNRAERFHSYWYEGYRCVGFAKRTGPSHPAHSAKLLLSI